MRVPRELVVPVVVVALATAPSAALAQIQPIFGDTAVDGTTIDRNPGVILQRLLEGPQVTEPDPGGEDRLPGLLATTITALFAGLNQVIPVIPFDQILFGRGDGTPGGIGRLVLTEVANDGNNSFVEVHNPGGIRLDLDDWALCIDADDRDCQSLSGLALEPGETLVLQLGGDPNPAILDQLLFLEVVASQGELALYDFRELGAVDPTNSSAMRAYLAWGQQLLNPPQLQTVALDGGLWRRLETLSAEPGLRDTAIQLVTSRLQIGGRNADDYVVVGFGQNTLGSTAVATPGDSSDGNSADDGLVDTPAVEDRGRSTFTRR